MSLNVFFFFFGKSFINIQQSCVFPFDRYHTVTLVVLESFHVEKRIMSLENYSSPPDAPVFYPTYDEFADPLEYIEKIRPIASRAGLCKIIPPKVDRCLTLFIDVFFCC